MLKAYSFNFKFKFQSLDAFLLDISSKNNSICDGVTIDGSVSKYGLLTSPNYPKWLASQNCASKINAPAGKVVRFHVNDIAMDDVTNNQ